MKNFKIFQITTMLVVAMLLIAGCAPATGSNAADPAAVMTQPSGGMMGETPSSGVPMTGSETEIDAMFIDMMVPHHQGAVEMAKIAQERAEHPEIKEMAGVIISGQEAEINQMKNWKQEWYGTSDTPPMSAMPMLEAMEGMGGMGHPMDMQADVEALRNASEPFDLAFIDAMIPHHQSAIDAAMVVLETASHSEIREMAQQIIDAQQKEIDQMNAWRQEWYPDAPVGQPSGH